MQKKIDNKITQEVANLIRIKVSPEDISKYAEQLNTVLSAVEVLNELDTEGVKESSQTHGLKNVLREDVAEPGLDMTKYKNTKNFRNGYFVVNKVI